MSRTLVLEEHLPFLRRYARALCGSQDAGDAQVKRCLNAIAASPADFPDYMSIKLGLFRAFSAQLASDGDPVRADVRRQTAADASLARTDFLARQCFLLTNLEEFTLRDAAMILGLQEPDVSQRIDQAMQQMTTIPQAEILIIEDEPLIALDLKSIIQRLNHDVIGIARTHSRALEMARATPPDLILADIRLADETSGVDAALDILKLVDAPVIFITAYPQRLLTGTRPEPTFLIRKPFTENQVRATVVQALLFHSSPSAVS